MAAEAAAAAVAGAARRGRAGRSATRRLRRLSGAPHSPAAQARTPGRATPAGAPRPREGTARRSAPADGRDAAQCAAEAAPETLSRTAMAAERRCGPRWRRRGELPTRYAQRSATRAAGDCIAGARSVVPKGRLSPPALARLSPRRGARPARDALGTGRLAVRVVQRRVRPTAATDRAVTRSACGEARIITAGARAACSAAECRAHNHVGRRGFRVSTRDQRMTCHQPVCHVASPAFRRSASSGSARPSRPSMFDAGPGSPSCAV